MVADNYRKTLIQRKREEWSNDQLYLAQSTFTNNYENEIKKMKNYSEKAYAQELKRQISERERQKVVDQERELSQDRFKLDQYRQYSNSLELSRRSKEEYEKEELLEYLKRQIN